MPAASVLVAVFVLCPQAATTNVDGILNGDFERLLPGSIGNSLTYGNVDGGWWVGAEGLTVDVQGDLQLQLEYDTTKNRIVYQRVGVPNDLADSAQIVANVTVPGGEEARISLTEADPEYWILSWVLHKSGKNFFINDPTWKGNAGEEPVHWECWEVDPTAYPDNQPRQMAYLEHIPGTTNPEQYEQGFTSPGVPGTTNNWVSYGATILQTPGIGPGNSVQGYMELRWQAPKKGWVKILSRPWHFNELTSPQFPTEDIEHQISLHPAAGGSQILRTDMVTHDDPNGPIIVERRYLEQGDEIRLRARRMWDGTGQPPPPDAKFSWHPAIVYEGATVTYRFGDSLAPCPETPFENFQCVTTVPNVEKNVTLDAGELFKTVFGYDPKPPLEVRLEVVYVAPNATGVLFDDVECRVDFEQASETDLRNAILAEARWARQNTLGQNPNGLNNPGILDHDTYGSKLGNLETFYAVHLLDILGGTTPNSSPSVVVNGPPSNIWPRLDKEYNDTDYTQFYTVLENQQFRNQSPVGLTYFKYDAVADEYPAINYDEPLGPMAPILISAALLTSSDPNYPKGLQGGAPLIIEQYRRTHDVSWLELAMNMAKIVKDNGVIGLDTSLQVTQPSVYTRVNLLAPSAYDIYTGQNLYSPGGVDADEVFGAWPKFQSERHIQITSRMIEVYAAAKLFNVA